MTQDHAVGQEPVMPSIDTTLLRSELRKNEYPVIEIFLDAQVKKASLDPLVVVAGVAQEQKYFVDCLAVKAKYP